MKRLNFLISKKLKLAEFYGCYNQYARAGIQGETCPQMEVEEITFPVMHSFLTLATALLHL